MQGRKWTNKRVAVSSFVFCLLASQFSWATELQLLVSGSVQQTGIIQAIAKRYQQTHSDLKIHFQTGNSRTLFQEAEKGQVDLVISHFPEGEAQFMANGLGTLQARFMYNVFAIMGPKDDDLQIASQKSLQQVLAILHQNEVEFFAPSQFSGTSYRLDQLWQTAGIQPNWVGYEKTLLSGSAVMRTANDMGAYTFVDMGSYAVHRAEIDQVIPLFRDSSQLHNYYTATVVNEARFNRHNQAEAEAFFRYLMSSETQRFIQQYGQTTYGIELYTPYAQLDETVIALQSAAERRQKYVFALLILLSGMVAGLLFWIRRQNRLRLLSDQRAQLDELTQIGNRRALHQATSALLAKETPFALLMIDLCDFKQINDQYGHAFGDEVLKQVAQRLKEVLGANGQVFRLGGDEFVVHLYQVTKMTESHISKLIAAFQKPVEWQGQNIQVVPSMGVAYAPLHSQDLEPLLHLADQAMYVAKSFGKPCHEHDAFSDASMDSK